MNVSCINDFAAICQLAQLVERPVTVPEVFGSKLGSDSSTTQLSANGTVQVCDEHVYAHVKYTEMNIGLFTSALF